MQIVMRATAPNPFEDESPAEELLAVWYRFTLACRPHLGLSKDSPMFRHAQSGLTWDPHTDVDEREARIARIKARAVDACIDALPTWQMRSSVDVMTCNRIADSRVVRNVRLTPEQVREAYEDALELLIPMFVQRGLMDRPLSGGTGGGTITSES